MSKLAILFHSASTWSFIGLFIYGGLTKVAPGLGGTFGQIVTSVLALLTLYLHSANIQTVATTGRIGGMKVVE